MEATYKERLLDISILIAGFWSLSKLKQNWNKFKLDKYKLKVEVVHSGYKGHIKWSDLYTEDQERLAQLEPVDEGFERAVMAGIHMALAMRGFYQGPCKRCDRKFWAVPYRPKNPKGGRPPLEWEYCPPCLLLRQRARHRANMRRYRARKQGIEAQD